MILTRPEYIIKQSSAVWSITKMLGDSGYLLDGHELEGVSSAIFNTLRNLDSACHELIPYADDDTLKDINRKLENATLIVKRLEEARNTILEKKS